MSDQPKTLHPIVLHLIYGDLDEMPVSVLGDQWSQPDLRRFIDQEQATRLQAAATVQAWLEGRLHKGGYLHDPERHSDLERLGNETLAASAGSAFRLTPETLANMWDAQAMALRSNSRRYLTRSGEAKAEAQATQLELCASELRRCLALSPNSGIINSP